VITLRARLGGQPVKIMAPPLDGWSVEWAARFAADFPAGVPQLVGLDVESTYMDGPGPWAADWACRTIQLAPNDLTGWVLRCDDLDQMIVAKGVLEDDAKEFTSHTQTDPHAVLVALGADVMGRYLDTHPFAIMNAPDDRAGQSDLKTVATRLGMPELAEADRELDEVFDRLYREAHPEIGRRAIARTKRERHGFDTVDLADPTFVKYAGLDAVAVRRVAPLLIRDLGRKGTPAHLLANERWLSEQVTRGKARGLLIDTERLEAMEVRTADAVAQATEELVEVSGLKPTQNAKLVPWFGEHITGGWPSDHPQTEGKAPSLGDGAHHRLRQYDLDDAGRAALEAYTRWQQVSNQHTLAAQVRAAMDPRFLIHPTIYSVGTITSRMSSAGPNAQNWAKPKELDDPARAQRELVLPGHPDLGPMVFVSCDFSQVEYRAAAALSGEEVLIETIMAGGDLHQLTADRIGISRQHAKTVNFAVLYGTGGAKLAKIMNYAITEAEGKEIVRAYWDAYPRLSALRDRMMAQDGVRLFSGRWVPTGKITKGERAGQSTVWANLNYLIQGNCRELLVGAWLAFARMHPDYAGFVRFPVHDELIVSCPWERRVEVCAALERAMSFDFFGVPITAEADVLVDEAGVSRWMSGDIARKIREAEAA
jgi:DNA polymerase I-like protein with 3'-5' exonuclease and polymerase domains